MEDSIMQKCPTILSDFIVGAKAFKEARKYRKQGATGIQVVPVSLISGIGHGRRKRACRSPVRSGNLLKQYFKRLIRICRVALLFAQRMGGGQSG